MDRGQLAREPAGRPASRAFPLLLILLLVGAAYLPVLRAGWVWDDDVYVTANPLLETPAGLRDIWLAPGVTPQYYPMVFTSFWVQHQLWGDAPLGYHIVNVALHALVAMLLWVLLARLGVPGAWTAAALFAVHPLCVESVAWVAELKNVQSAALGLGSLLLLLRVCLPEHGASVSTARRWGLGGVAVLLFAASLLTKPALVALPVVLLLLIWWKRGRIARGDLVAAAPLAVLSLAMAWVTMTAERRFSGAAGPEWQLPLLDRVLVAGRALWFYVGKILWPAELMSIYPRWETGGTGWLALFPLAAAAALAGLWLGRSRLGRGPFAAAASFAVLVAPALGLVPVSYHLYSFVADHFAYHAAPALIALAVAAAAPLAARQVPGAVTRAGVAVLLTALGVLSFLHARTFASEEVRCRATIAGNPGAWLAHNNLGVALAAQGKPVEAISHYREALRLRPVYAEAHSNLGNALAATGELDGAVQHHREALRIWPGNPKAHNNLGVVLARQGRPGEAVTELREALRLRPDYPEARGNLGVTLVALGRPEEALGHLEAALPARADDPAIHAALARALAATGRLDEALPRLFALTRMTPADPATHLDYGTALASAGRTAEAVAAYREALRLRPGLVQARLNLGVALAAQGQTEGALAEVREVLRLQPELAEAHRTMGLILAASGRLEEAAAAFREAVRCAPGWAAAHTSLGAALASLGRLDEAAAELERAVQLDPADAAARRNLDLLRLAPRGGR
ncbi:MAG TPA: tetratricopeptide repeat protein [Thermoanaerobaculaceae bacterium]|nr:tetratricopeptide repeat protein [Thermoanaerobaculaceae bacterium]HRS17647.1 tetratricopeptide repeat protein [Thermoanaerobaculaceae bacterium]